MIMLHVETDEAILSSPDQIHLNRLSPQDGYESCSVGDELKSELQSRESRIWCSSATGCDVQTPIIDKVR